MTRAWSGRFGAPAFGARLARGVGGVALALLLPCSAYAFDRLLDHIEADGRHIIVQFTCQMAYISHFPLRAGAEVRVELQPLPGCALGGGYSETLPVATTAGGGVKELRLETGVGARRALVVSFNKNVDYLVRPLPGLTGIEIVLAVRSGSVTVENSKPPTAASRAATRALPPQAELDQLEKDAMAAMRAKDYDAAIRLYTKLLEFPEHAARAHAQEYLGLARERKGQFAQAKAEYQEYLRRYPDGADVVEVSQRLAALVTLEGRSTPTRNDADARWQWQGAVSQEYRHDQNTLTQSGVTSNGVGQSVLYSDGDIAVRRRGEKVDFSARLDAGYLADLQHSAGSSTGSTRVSAAFAEWGDTGHHVLGRVGRQSETAGGVYGVFDGVYASWRINPLLRWNVSVGSPLQVYSAQASSGRVFASSGLELLGVARGLDLGLFVLEQKAGGYLDERELGADVRYYRDGRSLVAQANYDVSFKVINAATLLGTWGLPGRWIFTTSLDHRKAPFVSTYDALIGQPTTSLSDLVSQFGEAGVRRLALDRSANSESYTVGVQRPLGARVQWWTNISFNKLGSTPASGGVAAVPSLGGMVIYSTQLLGNGWLFDNDTHVFGASFGNGAGTRNVSGFLSARYALSERWRIGPRITVDDTRTTASAQTGVTNGLTASPSLLLEWQLRRGAVQFETGYEKTNQTLLDGNLTGQATSPATPGTPAGTTANPAVEIATGARRYWFSAGYHLSF